MNITKILEEHKESFSKAKEELEASRLRKPDREFPIKSKERTILTLKARVTNLTSAKKEAQREFDVSIKSMQTEITRLEKEIVDARNLLDIKVDDERGTSAKRESKIKNNNGKENDFSQSS